MAMTAALPIRLASEAAAAMAAAAAAAWPHEACGLLLGRRPAGGEMVVDLFRPTGNQAADLRRGYRVPPLELLAAGAEARQRGGEIVGVWHSHPDTPAIPSRRDADEAWEGYSYGIHAATREGAGELRFWELRGGVFHELRWEPSDDPTGGSR